MPTGESLAFCVLEIFCPLLSTGGQLFSNHSTLPEPREVLSSYMKKKIQIRAAPIRHWPIIGWPIIGS